MSLFNRCEWTRNRVFLDEVMTPGQGNEAHRGLNSSRRAGERDDVAGRQGTMTALDRGFNPLKSARPPRLGRLLINALHRLFERLNEAVRAAMGSHVLATRRLARATRNT